MFRDNPSNVLGVNTADNQYVSDLVVANADGSVLERLEALQAITATFVTTEVLVKGVVDTAIPSTTNVKCAGLLGYGEDFFNDNFYMQVLRSGGAAPEPEVRKITNYMTATGTFTVDAFSQNVESGDLILILHQSAVAVGENNADNVFDSSSVVANADGSVLERLEALKDQVTAVDDLVDTEITTLIQQTARTTAKKTAATPVTQNLFTVAGGAIRILAIVGHITTAIAAGANNAKLVFTSTGGAAVDLCAAADIAGMAIRKLLTITGTAANPIALSAAEGVVVSAVATTPIIVTPGVLSLNCTAGTTGVIDWYIEYEPLAAGAAIT